ncbi:MAG: hypothetical protein ACKVJE_19470 [Pseudomonadales bacterium]
MFHTDSKLLPAGKPTITGIKAIEAFLQASFDAGLALKKRLSSTW